MGGGEGRNLASDFSDSFQFLNNKLIQRLYQHLGDFNIHADVESSQQAMDLLESSIATLGFSRIVSDLTQQMGFILSLI